MSTTVSILGSCAGSAPRLVRRLAARSVFAAGEAGFRPGLAGGDLLLDVFQPQGQLIGVQGLGAPAEAVALQGLDDLAQALVLGVGMILGQQGGCVLGPLLQEQGLQRLDIAGKRLGHRAI